MLHAEAAHDAGFEKSPRKIQRIDEAEAAHDAGFEKSPRKIKRIDDQGFRGIRVNRILANS